ncbi:MAG TPA: acetate/propionate family kinase [Conexibacter sp.]|jgi:acetate kinase
MRVLVVNAGSSSLKHAIVDSRAIGASPDGAVLADGEERWEPDAAGGGGGAAGGGRHREALTRALATHEAGAIDAIGHRVVHGGPRFTAAAVIDDDVRAGIEQAAQLAPLHNGAALEGIDAARAAFPALPQVACFDTAFHRTLALAARTYAIPREWAAEHAIRRYGFHGLNVAWCSERARALLGDEATRRLIVCHLGSGCSVTAVLDGRSIDTSMGFTPLDGVPMATRSGALDPGIVLHLQRVAGLTVEQLDDGLNHRAGLLGVSGRSADLRAIVAAADAGDEPAQLAFDVFVRGISGAVGALCTALGGLDTLVFTGGAGERSAPLRAAVAARLAHLGVALDPARNAAPAPDRDLAPTGAKTRLLTFRAREELVVARETAAALGEPH